MSQVFDPELEEFKLREGVRDMVVMGVTSKGRRFDSSLCIARLLTSAIYGPDRIIKSILYIGPPRRTELANDNRWGIGTPA